MDDHILITGARVNNLKNLTVRIPKNRLVVFTGVSGSGKSSIVFDTVAVESQRQLNETYTWFIRNRLPKYEKPEADSIDNLGPALVVDQKPVGGSSRSTVGTMTDIMPIIRVLFSRYGTPSAGYSFAYSFNDPQGMCGTCDGLGRAIRLDLDAFLDPAKSLDDGAIRFPLFGVGTWQWQIYARSGTFDPAKPLRDYTPRERELFLHGGGFKVDVTGKNGTLNKVDYEGVADRFTRLYLKRDLSGLSERNRRAVQAVITEGTCPLCHGARLNQAALATRIGPHTIADYSAMEVSDLINVLSTLDDPAAATVAAAAVTALSRIERIGLGYLTLDRETATLSGGEGQRLKTVRHLGSSLTGMTYIFDEPSAGLHPSDVGRLNDLLLALRDKGNTVLVVEHDPDVITIADHVIDLGPGAGTHGGEIVFQGGVAGLTRSGTTTGRHLHRRTPLKPHPRT
ncbi:excinuclease ABC subunit UvrA, partial [Nonomuraea sp. NN258]|nr:excinuclease ABC subunit UvrA [Nonomuraea antri]